MASAAAVVDEKCADFYGVLGLETECTAQELRSAYKRLAMRWHPDRCSGNPRSVEEAKKKFQGIQEAYSVLSDSNKRFSYDVGVYRSDDGDENDMGDFLSEMAAMMSQTKPSVSSSSQKNGEESFEQLQELFHEMFKDDINLSNTSSFDFNPSSSSSPTSFFSCNYDDISSSKHKLRSTNYAQGSSDAHFQNVFSRSGSDKSSTNSFCNSKRTKRRNSPSKC